MLAHSLSLSLSVYIYAFPGCFGHLSNLTSLDLSCNEISVIPDCLGQLSNLTSLNLSCNYQISVIPECLGQLSNLTSLDLSYIPNLYFSGFVLAKLTKLDYFRIDNSSLVSLTEDVLENDHLHLLSCLFEGILSKRRLPAGSKIIYNNSLVFSIVDLLLHKFIYMDFGSCIELVESLDLEILHNP